MQVNYEPGYEYDSRRCAEPYYLTAALNTYEKEGWEIWQMFTSESSGCLWVIWRKLKPVEQN